MGIDSDPTGEPQKVRRVGDLAGAALAGDVLSPDWAVDHAQPEDLADSDQKPEGLNYSA